MMNVLVKGNTNPDSSGCLASVNSRPAGHAQGPKNNVSEAVFCPEPAAREPKSLLSPGTVLLSHPLGAPMI